MKDKINIPDKGVDDNSNMINESPAVYLCPVGDNRLETSELVDESGLDESHLDFYSPTGYTTSELDTTDMAGLETTTDMSALETTTDIHELETTTESIFAIDKTGDTSSATYHKSDTETADEGEDTGAYVGLTETENISRDEAAEAAQTEEADLEEFSKQYVENLIENVAKAKLDDDNETNMHGQIVEENLGLEQTVETGTDDRKDQLEKAVETDLTSESSIEAETAVEVQTESAFEVPTKTTTCIEVQTDNSSGNQIEKELKIDLDIENEMSDLLDSKNEKREEQFNVEAKTDIALENVSIDENVNELKLDQTEYKHDRDNENNLENAKETEDKFDSVKETVEGDFQVDTLEVEVSKQIKQIDVENDEIFQSDDEATDYVDSSLTNVTAMTHPSLSDSTFQNTPDSNILVNELGERVFRNVIESRKDSLGGICESCGSDMSSFLDTTGCSSEFSFYACYDCQQIKEPLPDAQQEAVEVENVEKSAEVFEVAPDAEDHLNRAQIDDLWQGISVEKSQDLKQNEQSDKETSDLDADVSEEGSTELNQAGTEEITLLQKQKEEEDILGQYSTIVLTPLKIEPKLDKQTVESDDENVTKQEQFDVELTDMQKEEQNDNIVNTDEEVKTDLDEGQPLDATDGEESFSTADDDQGDMMKPEYEVDGAVGGQITDSSVPGDIIEEVASLLSELQDIVCEGKVDDENSANIEELKVLDDFSKFSIEDVISECPTEAYDPIRGFDPTNVNDPTNVETNEANITDQSRPDVTVEGIQSYLCMMFNCGMGMNSVLICSRPLLLQRKNLNSVNFRHFIILKGFAVDSKPQKC